MTKIIEGVLLIMFLTVAVKSRAQSTGIEDTLVGKTLVALADFKSGTTSGMGFSHDTKYTVKDVNTGKPVEVKKGSEWKCDKVDLSDYTLSDSGITISVSKTSSYKALGYWVITQGPSKDDAVISISGFLEKNAYIAMLNKESMRTKKRLTPAERDSINAKIGRERLAKYISEYGEKNGTEIFQHKVEVGYTEAMCIDALGSPAPDNVSEATVDGQTETVWLYENNDSSHTIISFSNGVITKIDKE